MAFEWVAGLFQSDNQQTRGLSGDNAGSVALDDANPYYNYRLRRHKAEGDIIGDPGLLWYTSPYVKRRSGLGTHVGAEIGDGTANYSDVLMILSREDHARSTPDWEANATRVLQQEFENFCRRESFSRLHAHRQLGFRFLQDGSPEMGGQSLGLQAGEFVSGLLPNLYTGPVRGSYPVIGVHVNLPGVWEGYQEVGRLYNDQILFTLGSHWLDNFSHPSLTQAALYRLRQYPDGSFVHIINPDLQDQYQVTSTNQGGASVLTLATRVGQPLAYLVLAVIDPPSTRPSKPPTGESSRPGARNRPDIKLPSPAPRPPAPKKEPEPTPQADRSPGGVPSIAPPMLLDEPSGDGGLGGKTIIPDAPSERIFTFQERGALLQKVHFSAFMLGYDVYLSARGELGTHVEDHAATFQVRKRSVSLVSHVDGVRVGGRPVPAGVEVPIEGDLQIEVAGQRLEYRDLRGMRVDGWPYVGEIRRPASSTYMIWGEDYQIGRSRECRVVLPDEPRNDNIHWKPSVGDGATIRARTGEIPKSRFYTDSIMVASEHATVDLRDEGPKVVCTARHCYVYIRRSGEVLPLYPATSGRQPQELDIEPGDEILIGNCLFHVGFTPSGDAVAPGPAPKVELSSDSLASAVDEPDLHALDKTGDDSDEPPELPPGAPPAPPADEEDADEEPPGPPPPPEEPPSAEEAPPPPSTADPLDAPTGRPAPPPVQPVGMDSILADPDSTAGPLDGESPIPDLHDDDEPTVPGLVVPSDALDDDRPTWEDPSLPDEADLAAAFDDEADEAAADDDAGHEPEEPEDDEPASAEAPLDESVEAAAEVPTPFPEVDEADAPEPPARLRDLTDDETAAGDETPDAPVTDDDDELDATVAFPRSGLVDEPDLETRPLDPSQLPDDDVPDDTAEQAVEPAVTEDEPETVTTLTDLPTTEGGPTVVVTDDHEAQFELGRPMHLIQAGWMINGEVVCGNHAGADLILPENRIVEAQTFAPRDYFRLRVRGRRGYLEVLSPSELLIDEDDAKQGRYDEPHDLTIDVIRRDDAGEEDFAVRLTIVEDRALPDPRARFVSIDTDDPLAAALVTRGLPKGAARTLVLDGVHLELLFDGEVVTVSEYLDTYRRDGGFHPFFVQQGDSRFVTAPEDGSPFQVRSGDRIVVGTAVYVLREE